MRILGWTLFVVGTLAFARTLWLAAMYSPDLSDVSMKRAYILLAVIPCIALLGAWLVYRRRGSHT